MKKLHIFILLILSLFMFGCNENKKPDEEDVDIYQEYINLVKIPEKIEGDLLLPAQVNQDGKHDIYWESSDKEVIKVSNSNIVTQEDNLLYYKTRVQRYETDIEVTLTMRLEVVGYPSKEVDYQVIVLKEVSSENNDIINFTFYGVNDFHGAVYSEKAGGLSILGNYLIDKKEKQPNTTVMIASGDMFQGSAISNMTQGGVVVEAMNEIGFDAMCMGNHEFDWGIDIIRDYNNKTSETVANFPIICCNIYEKATNKPVDWCEPYTIIERSGIKIGIIGAMGSELETSIAQNRIAPFEFVDPIPLIKKYTSYLRNTKDCELVVLTIHDNTEGIINTTLADLSGEYQIDAVFNGHTHATYAGETLGSDGVRMPYIQSGCYGTAIGEVKLSYNKKTKKLIEVSARNIPVSKNLMEHNQKLDEIIKKYDDKVAPIANEVLGVSGVKVDQSTCAKWAVNVIRDLSGCEVGFINSGGIRNGAFPINKDEEIKVSRVWEIMPFDNMVKTCTLKASDCVEAYYAYDMLHSSNCRVDELGRFVVNGKALNPDDLVKVAAVDYVFDKPNFPFVKGTNQVNTGELFRDYLIQAFRDECKGGNKWQCAR